ncbi:MAG: prephenate dehydratase [Lachnospira sp.]|nr:prephenate dehydratase [Lachnospira sp.]
MLDLNHIRDELDVIDAQIVDLYKKRMELSKDVATFKIANNKPVLDPVREAAKLKTITGMVDTDFDKAAIGELFKQVMATSRKLQYQILEDNLISAQDDSEYMDYLDTTGCKVVYQGVPGAYSHTAMKQFFGENVDHINVPTFRDAMEALKNGEVDYAILPIENSSAGIVNDTYDLLQEYNHYIVAETFVKIEHSLLGLKGSSIDNIKTVYSHPQGLMQCSHFLENYKEWQQISQANTAMSAKKVLLENDPTQAAIASEEAARYYGLEILAKHINFSDVNTTRFVIISAKRKFIKNANKMSICFETPHQSGSLYGMLSHIIYNGLNMTKIESRPIEDRKWEWRFFVDFNGNMNDAAVKNALRGIEAEAISLKFLGNY